MVNGIARRVHATVSADPTVRHCETVAPCPHEALTVRRFKSQALQTGHDRLVVSRHGIFCEEHDRISVVPGCKGTHLIVGYHFGVVGKQGSVFRPAAGE